MLPNIPVARWKQGDRVLLRHFGCVQWKPATVTAGFVDTASLIEEIDELMEGELLWCDNHMLKPFEEGLHTADTYFDKGYYERGDYVEVLIPGETAWRRARVAKEESPGMYTVRTEDGKDNAGIQGCRLRHLFKAGQKMAAKVSESGAWDRGTIVKRETNGYYVIVLDKNEERPYRVYSKSIWPFSKSLLRDVIRARQREIDTGKALLEASARHEEEVNRLKERNGGASITFTPSAHAVGSKCRARRGPDAQWMPGQVTDVNNEEKVATVSFVDGTTDTLAWSRISMVNKPSPARSRPGLASQIAGLRRGTTGAGPDAGDETSDANNGRVVPGLRLSHGQGQGKPERKSRESRWSMAVMHGDSDYEDEDGFDEAPISELFASPRAPLSPPRSSQGFRTSPSTTPQGRGVTTPAKPGTNLTTIPLSAGNRRVSENQQVIYHGIPGRNGIPGGELVVNDGSPGNMTAAEAVEGGATAFVPVPLHLCDHLNSASMRDILQHICNDVGISDPIMAFDAALALVKDGNESWADVKRLDCLVASRGDWQGLQRYLVAQGMPAALSGKLVEHLEAVRNSE